MSRVLVVGVGRMGFAHAKACASIEGNEIVGLVARDFSKWQEVTSYFPDVPLYNDFYKALTFIKPDAVLISSYTDTHAEYSIASMKAGADVFVEKPLALNVKDAGRVINAARQFRRKLYVGYILRHHSLWQKFVTSAQTLQGPLKVTMTCNQHSIGEEWELHKNILNAGLSPLVDAGIHYVDLMAQLTAGELTDIKAVGAKSSDDMVVENETNMTITYSDGSVFYFESGFGPNINPGDVPIKTAISANGYAEITPKDTVLINDVEHRFEKNAYDLAIFDQQKYFFDAINKDIDLEGHWRDVALSLATVLIAEGEMTNS